MLKKIIITFTLLSICLCCLSCDALTNDATETTDTDGDGVENSADAFPNDATETTDTDGDGAGDNADAFPNDATSQQYNIEEELNTLKKVTELKITM